MTFTSLAAVRNLPSVVATTTRTFDVSPIFTRSATYGSAAPCAKSKFAAYGNGFFSSSTTIDFVPGMLLWISIGTTAPFSAMSGARITMSFVSTGAAILSCFSASATVFDSKAPRFHSAAASPGRSHPATIAVAARAPVRLRAVRRGR